VYLAASFIRVNRYIGEETYQASEAQASVINITDVFEAESKAKAEKMARRMLRVGSSKAP
jgi:hypothetical protein